MSHNELPSVISIKADRLSDIGVTRVLTPDELARALGAPRPIPPTPSHPSEAGGDVFRGLKELEAKRLNLERVEVKGNIEAQKLLERIFNSQSANRFDVANTDDAISKRELKRFVDEWERKVPNIPVPCFIQHGYTLYLQRLAQGTIIKNLDPKKKIPAIPNFDKPITLWIENWQEADYTDNKVKNAVSPLLQELGVKQSDKKVAAGVVNISREAVDEALWSGDPSTKTKTQKHTALLVKLGLDPARHNFRLIAQDEYARLAGVGKNFGKSNLWTWFNDYWVDGAVVHGLFGGHRVYGGPSDVDSVLRDSAAEFLALRLVLECNK